MSCISDIAKNIISNCTTQGSGGNEVKGWIMKRSEFTPTYDNTNPSKITSIALPVGAKAYTFTGVKKLLNSGHDFVSEDNRADGFTHYVGFSGFEFDAASVENFDSLDDLVFVAESKDKTTTGDGVFRVYGAKQGLVKSSDTMRANDNYGARVIEMSTPSGMTEAYSNYTFLHTDYATSLADLVALETIQVAP